MKILVTGSSGFVGKHLTRLLSKKHKVVPFDLKEGLDIRNPEMLDRASSGVDAIVHLAALVVAPESWDKPYDYFVTNGLGTLNVVLAGIKNKVGRIILTSSAAVYGEPLNPYGASKRWAENVAETYKEKIKTVVIRPFNIYGKGQNPSYGFAIHSFAAGIKKDGIVSIYGDGGQTRDFISVTDVTRTIEYLLKTTKLPDSPVDLGTGRDITIKSLAALEGKLLGRKFTVKYLKKRQEPYKSVADTKLLQKIGVKVNEFTRLEDGLKDLIL